MQTRKQLDTVLFIIIRNGAVRIAEPKALDADTLRRARKLLAEVRHMTRYARGNRQYLAMRTVQDSASIYGIFAQID